MQHITVVQMAQFIDALITCLYIIGVVMQSALYNKNTIMFVYASISLITITVSNQIHVLSSEFS